MRTKTIELVAGGWIVVSAAVVYGSVVVAPPSIYLAVIFLLLVLTVVATGYVVWTAAGRVARSSRRHHAAGIRLHKDTLQSLRNLEGSRSRADEKSRKTLTGIAGRIDGVERAVLDSEAARARAAAQLNNRMNLALQELSGLAVTISRTTRAVSDSEAARARGTVQINSQLNTALAQLETLAAVIGRLRGLTEASHDQLMSRADHPAQLAQELTRHAVTMEMYLDEIKEAMVVGSSHKEQVLARLSD